MIYFVLMKKERKDYPPCEAPIHNEDCDGIGGTVDHFTPMCIAKLWGWKNEEINAKENIQHLSVACHREKDKTTEARLTLARQQLRGAYISLDYYKTIEDPNFHLERLDKLPMPKKEKHKKHRNKINRNPGEVG